MTLEERNRIVLENLAFADALATRFYPSVRAHNPPITLDDLKSCARLALVRAIPSYRADRPIIPFVHRCISNALIDVYRSESRHPSTCGSPEIPVIQEQPAESFFHLTSCLDPVSSLMITLVYREGYTVQESGRILSLSPHLANKVHYEAIQQMRSRATA